MFVLVIVLCAGCADKKTDLSGDRPVKPAEFLAAFPELSLPISVADTNINKRADTAIIGYKALQQFFPDSVLVELFGKDTRQVIHPVGKIQKGKDAEIYLLLNSTNRKKATRLGVFVVDKKLAFKAAKKLITNDINDGYTHLLTINREPTFMIGRERSSRSPHVANVSREGESGKAE